MFCRWRSGISFFDATINGTAMLTLQTKIPAADYIDA
jgi:hypothetical protein